MGNDYRYITESIITLRNFIKSIVIASIVGIVVGLVSVCFHISIEKATELRIEYSWVMWFLPLGGVAIVWLYQKAGMEKDRGTNFVLEAVRDNNELTIKTAPLIFISTVITHLFGGSSGREGAALQIGGSISSYIGKAIKLDEKEQRLITMCGMSAGFAALFGTPVTAVIFSMEVITVGVMHYSAIVPCVVSAVVGSYTAKKLGVPETFFVIKGIPEIGTVVLLKILVLGVLFAAVSMLFCLLLKKTHILYEKIHNKMFAAFVGGIVIIALTYIFGTKDYNGAGMNVINAAASGEAKPEAFLLKMILTAATLGAGFKGGEIVPTLFVGATFGNVAAEIIGLNPSFGAGLGMVALFCGVTNCPLTSIILSIELFGSEGILFYTIVCAVSYKLSGYYGLYSSQKIVYSKHRPEYIDQKIL